MDLRQLLDQQSNQEDIQVNQEDIIRMAQEAHGPLTGTWWDMDVASLKRFAVLVAKAERERLASQIDRMPFGDTAASFSIWIREQR